MRKSLVLCLLEICWINISLSEVLSSPTQLRRHSRSNQRRMISLETSRTLSEGRGAFEPLSSLKLGQKESSTMVKNKLSDQVDAHQDLGSLLRAASFDDELSSTKDRPVDLYRSSTDSLKPLKRLPSIWDDVVPRENARTIRLLDEPRPHSWKQCFPVPTDECKLTGLFVTFAKAGKKIRYWLNKLRGKPPPESHPKLTWIYPSTSLTRKIRPADPSSFPRDGSQSPHPLFDDHVYRPPLTN